MSRVRVTLVTRETISIKSIYSFSNPLSIQRTPYPENVFCGDMGINHCGLEISMTKQLLNRSDVISVLQEVGRKAVPQGMH